MNLMELFGRRVEAAPAPQQVTLVNADGSQVTPPTPDSVNTNTTVPNDGTGKSDGKIAAFPATAEGEASPLENYKDLWQAPDPTKAVKKPSLAPDFNIDSKTIRENASKINFASVVPGAILDKAIAGDKAAFLQAMNLTAQAGFAKAAEMSAGLTHAALTKQSEAFETHVMPDILRRHNISNQVRADNPIFENPAVTPLLTMLESQLTTKYPAASAEEITRMSKEYLGGFSEEYLKGVGKQVVAAPTADSSKKGKRDTDWTSYFAT